MHANGGREEDNNYLLDGVDNNDQDVNRFVLQPSVDTIQEFKIATNSYSAEYGRNAGGQVNVITRSGTNDWHGFAYDYLRNRDLDARNFFDGSTKPEYVRNQFGGGAGGSIVKNRTFFYVSYDSLRERSGLSQLATVPTAAERSGDLSAGKGTAQAAGGTDGADLAVAVAAVAGRIGFPARMAGGMMGWSWLKRTLGATPK